MNCLGYNQQSVITLIIRRLSSRMKKKLVKVANTEVTQCLITSQDFKEAILKMFQGPF